jgi:Gas vesicle synthesis protein GvpL/GvpF
MARIAKTLSQALLLYGIVDADTAKGRTAARPSGEPADRVSQRSTGDGADHTSNHSAWPGSLTFVDFRDLSAVVCPRSYTRMQIGERELSEYVHVVDELYTRGPVLPAPPGAVFRSADVLRRWLELHYAKLHEALGQVEQRTDSIAPYDFIQMDLGA